MRKILMLAAFCAALPAMASADDGKRRAVLYKNPQCGCCETYADYMRQNGYTVVVRETHDLPMMSREAGIADEMQGCHMTYVDGYVVSGHVPAEAVDRLLDERPPIKGITLPGMPMGSPGMSGEKTAPFTIYEIGGPARKVYAIE